MEDFTLPSVGQASKNEGVVHTPLPKKPKPLLHVRTSKKIKKKEDNFFYKNGLAATY
jgi:hypothetical protein